MVKVQVREGDANDVRRSDGRRTTIISPRTLGPVTTMYCAKEGASIASLSAWQSAVRWDEVKAGRRKPHLLETPSTNARIGPARGRKPSTAAGGPRKAPMEAAMLAIEARTSICAMVAGGVERFQQKKKKKEGENVGLLLSKKNVFLPQLKHKGLKEAEFFTRLSFFSAAPISQGSMGAPWRPAGVWREAEAARARRRRRRVTRFY
jgi:hypothetical protein